MDGWDAVDRYMMVQKPPGDPAGWFVSLVLDGVLGFSLLGGG